MPEVNGTTYDPGTKQEIIDILERCRTRRERVRFRYGGDDGQDWGDSCDMEGYIGRSCGQYKVPLVIYNSRSDGGPSILDNRIIRIETTKGRRLLYQHPAYKPPKEESNAVPPM
jgi:hypothetical protein